MIIKDFFLQRKWIMLTFAFAAVTLATSGYLIYREICRPKKHNAILSKYGYLFRQANEMNILNELISQEPQTVTETDKPTKDNCKLSCPKKTYAQQAQNQASSNENTTDSYILSNNTNIDKTKYIVNYSDPVALPVKGGPPEIKYSYHGCCVSSQGYISPKSLMGISGKMLRIVQFRRQKQYFLADSCQQAKDCTRGCQCKQQMITAIAVVVDSLPTNEDIDEDVKNDYIEKNARIDRVKYGGWCKCFNQ